MALKLMFENIQYTLYIIHMYYKYTLYIHGEGFLYYLSESVIYNKTDTEIMVSKTLAQNTSQ